MAKYYQTTTIPYVNAEPHIGFALEIVQADTIARYRSLMGDDVIFNFGTDEHGVKIYEKALAANKTPQEYCDEYAVKFDALKKALNLSYNKFIRTTDTHHIAAAQEFWKLAKANDDIYKKLYKIKYCVGCELEKTDSELVESRCPLHPNQDIQVYEEENYFFRFSKYQNALLELYKKNPQFVVPENKLNEIRNFVEQGLQDFSITRLKAKMPWGIDVPDDPDHVMYVWFDALINYISTIGWPTDKKQFQDYWPVVQFAGKDQVRQQAAMWQAMLMSVQLPSSKQIFIHGFMTVDGQKISKSLGNTIDPIQVAKEYGTDTLRYYLLAKIHPTEDSDFSWDKFKQSYNSDLANGLGNLVARVAKLCETIDYTHDGGTKTFHDVLSKHKAFQDTLEAYKFSEALAILWEKITLVDRYINDEKPWVLVKSDAEKAVNVLAHCVNEIQEIALLLQPFLPETAGKIQEQYKGPKIVSGQSLFPRL
ncbi:MAG: methionine--tRNA ligase [Candidatus Levybacteria bacterium]|nr:methionine--tRNA ligase [Candidatus Levybacteria bacterium]